MIIGICIPILIAVLVMLFCLRPSRPPRPESIMVDIFSMSMQQAKKTDEAKSDADFYKAECARLREALQGCGCNCIAATEEVGPYICAKHMHLSAHHQRVAERGEKT